MSQTLALLHAAKGFVFVAATPVRPHHPLVIPGDYLLDLLVPVPGPHLVDSSLIGIEGHQVGLLPTHLPAGIVGVDYWRVPNPSPQFLIRLAHPAPGPAQRILSNGPLGQLHPSQQVQDQGCLEHWNPHLVVQGMGSGHSSRPQSVGGSPVLVWRQVRVLTTDPPATPEAALQGHGYVHWWFSDCFRTWCLAEREGALPRLAAGALGIAHPSAFGEGSSLALGAALQLSDFTAQGRVAGGQLSHLTLQLG